MQDLVSLEDYKQFASIEGNKGNPQILSLIQSCSQIVQDYLGYTVGIDEKEATTIIRTRANATEYMVPIVDATVTKVVYKPRGGSLEQEVDPDEYNVEDSGLLTLYSIKPRDGDTLKITYNVGREITEAVQLATLLLIKFYYKEEFNKTSVSSSGQTVSYQVGKNFPPHIRAILMMYRLL